jgi:hypothetical protein
VDHAGVWANRNNLNLGDGSIAVLVRMGGLFDGETNVLRFRGA